MPVLPDTETAAPPAVERSFVKRSSRGVFVSVLVTLVCASLLLTAFATSSPKQAQLPRTFTIDEGMSVSAIAKRAEREGFVRSSLLLYAVLTYFHDPTSLFAGSYRLDKELSLFEFANKLATKDILIENVVLTIPEGTRAKDIAAIAERTLSDFDEAAFLSKAIELEGYLFPETYHIPASFSNDELLELMKSTFDEKTMSIREAMLSHPLGEYGVLTLASIIEREANDETSMRIVSGILQNRLNEAMPLQADASIEYALEKPLSQLTPQDLERDTPYNTYLFRGLPPTPIGNPGLAAINAVLNPTETDYFYYITGNDGTFYYSRTYDEHLTNIEAFLR